MPLTPLHLGPGLSIGLVFKRWINLPAILIASIIVDARAIYRVFILGNWSNLHGFFHTFIGATLLGLLTIIAVWVLREQLYTISKALKVEQDYSMYSIVAGSLIGVWLHIVLDSYMHQDMKPFWPFLEGNPLYGGLFASFELLYLCLFGFLVGIVYYIAILLRSR